MSGGRFSLTTLQELSNAGLLQSGSRLRFRPAGSTTTLQDTYSNPSLTTPNANPVVADSYGRFTADIYMSDLPYRVEVLPPAGNDTPVMTFDPVYKDRVIIQATAAPANPWPDMEYVNTTDGRRYRRNRANSAWVDLGPYDSVGNVAAKSDVIAASSTTLFVTPDALEAIWGRGTDIASASTLTLPASEGAFFVVTGATTITGIAATTEGRRILLYFSSTPLLDHGASFDLGGQDLKMEAGEMCEFLYYNSIWYLVDRVQLRRNTLPTSTKTTDYTVVDSDFGSIIYFSSLGADVTLTLPTAVGRAGKRLTIVLNYTATDYGVTINPDGSETIDNQTTRKGYGPMRVTIESDGAEWYTVSGMWLWHTTRQDFTLGAGGNVAHGQPYAPVSFGWFLECVTGEDNYSAGDRIQWHNDASSGVSANGFMAGGNATNLFYRQGTATMNYPDKTTGANAAFTHGSWKVVVWGLFP